MNNKIKPEIIVIKIEEYINSLSKEDRAPYDSVMNIKTKHPEESIRTFANASGDPILNLAVIIDELKQEIKESAIKQTKGKSVLQRIKKINNYLSSSDTIKEQSKTAWIENGKMCFTNGYTGFVFNEILEGIEIREQSDFNLGKCFPDESNYMTVFLDISEVKAQLKLHKTKETGLPKKAKTKCIYIVDGHYYDAEFLIEAYEILGGEIVFRQNDNTIHPAVLESENGKAVVLPIRPPKS